MGKLLSKIFQKPQNVIFFSRKKTFYKILEEKKIFTVDAAKRMLNTPDEQRVFSAARSTLPCY